MKMYKKLVAVALLVFFGLNQISAQSGVDPEYVKVTNERAQKIVDDLKLKSKEDQLAVRDIIAEQYRSLSKIQETRDAKIAEIKKKNTDKAKEEKATEKVKNDTDKKI